MIEWKTNISSLPVDCCNPNDCSYTNTCSYMSIHYSSPLMCLADVNSCQQKSQYNSKNDLQRNRPQRSPSSDAAQGVQALTEGWGRAEVRTCRRAHLVSDDGEVRAHEVHFRDALVRVQSRQRLGEVRMIREKILQYFKSCIFKVSSVILMCDILMPNLNLKKMRG